MGGGLWEGPASPLPGQSLRKLRSSLCLGASVLVGRDVNVLEEGRQAASAVVRGQRRRRSRGALRRAGLGTRGPGGGRRVRGQWQGECGRRGSVL